MLKQMREGAKSPLVKIVLFGLLLLAMGGLALIGGGQAMFKEGLKDDTIGSINRERLQAQTFDRIVQNVLRDQRMKQSDAYRAHLPLQVLKQEIINPRVFSMAANDLGLQVDDTVAAQQVKEAIQPLVEKGLSPKEALERLEQSQNTSEAGLVASIKAQTSTDQLVKMITSGVSAPQQLTADALKFRNEYRSGEYFRLTAANAGDVKAPSDADLKTYYTSIASEYALPEYRTLSVIILDKKALGDAANISDDRLKQYYDENINDYKTGESRVISQVVAQDEGTAKAIYDAAVKNKDLQAAGKGKGSYIKPEAFTQKEIAPELSQAAFSGQVGQILPPVKSPLGWHVISIEKVTPGSTKTFEMVKADIAKELSQDKVSEALYQKANKIDDQIGGGKSLAEVAKENNIAETVLNKVDAHGVGADGAKPTTSLPIFDKLVTAGFALNKGAASQLIETPDGAFAIVSVNEIYPSDQQPFEKVRDKVLARWMTDHQLKALADKAAQITDRLKQGESFNKIATEFNQSVQMTGMIQRAADPAKVKLESGLITALFSLDKAGQATSFRSENAITVIRLASRQIQVPVDTAKKDADDMTAILNRSLKQDLLEQYRQSLLAKYDVKINERLLTSMYTAKEDNNNGVDSTDGEE